ncbi:putative methyltransferase, LIC12133 family [Terrimicrobium sacchariphilum]|uniref:Putative methyltransferase, LIC12133 family n=1 Tax=Terrimicrobium sacchariphilum TaxID=690879 RepID=A0A146G5H2_TERSA|nr:methyltransferase, TIGR04325 family [Terrimicrobium sacchariphilum]GAT31996.1 putative methyltransferase, LIC12133 family [Terrimicrobium sacchariphilum]
MALRDIPSFREYLWKVYSALRGTADEPEPAAAAIEPPVFSGDYPSWDVAAAECGGYDADQIFIKIKEAAIAVRDGFAAFERDSVLFEKPEYRWETLAALLWQAARDRGELRVLDFGGSLGSVYFQSRVYLTGLPRLLWGVVEQPHYVDFGNRELSSEALRFFREIDQGIEEVRPNAAFFGASLQYVDSPFDILDSFLSRRVSSVIFDKLALIDQPEDRLTIQRVPKNVYEASYPAWFFSECRFLKYVKSAGYSCVSEWRNVDHYLLEGGQTIFKGYHFVRRD